MLKVKSKKKTRNRVGISLTLLIAMLIITSNFLLIETKSKNDKYDTSEEKTIENSKIPNKEKIKENLRNMNGFFTKNQGQLENDEIYFIYSGNNINFGFLESSVLIKLSKTLENNKTKSSVFKIIFESSNKVIPKGIKELSHKNNYFIGNNSTKWKSNVLNYEKIVYKNLYDGIDLVYYFNENGLKYDWIVKAYAEPSKIVESFEGIDSINVDSDGGLIIETEAGELKEGKPYSFQEICGNIVEVDMNFKIVGEYKLIYEIEDYDSSKKLIIDPLIYSTFVGGSKDDECHDVILDSENNLYVTGHTISLDFPITSGCLNESYNGGFDDVFVFKMNSDCTDLLYSTFIGGSDCDRGYGIELDIEKNAYITGSTDSSDFPTTSSCFDDSYSGWFGHEDIFVFKLNLDGSNLLYSTYVGGNGSDICENIALDSEKNAYVIGWTTSTNFPTTPGCFDDSYNGGDPGGDVFVFKLKSDSSDLVYSTFIGGKSWDFGYGIALDSKNNVFVTGETNSSDFPLTSDCFNNSHTGVFVFKLNHNGSSLLYSTFIGRGRAKGIALDSNNNAYITGETGTSGFPTTPNCYKSYHNKGLEVFVLKLNSNGTDLIYSTYIGEGIGKSIALDSDNNAYITGETKSSDFPTTSGCFDNTHNGNDNVYVFKLNKDGFDLIYSTFIGRGRAKGIALDSNNNAYITGETGTSDFPTTPGCFDNSYNGKRDVFVFKSYLPKPILNVIFPTYRKTIYKNSKSVNIKGNASVDIGKITKVQIQINDGEWFDAKGTTNWTYEWDLSEVPEGTYIINVRALDEGSSCLVMKSIIVYVIEKEEKNQTVPIILIISLFILLVLLFSIHFWYDLIENRKEK